MLSLQDAIRECLSCVVIENGDSPLQDDRTRVELGRDQVDGDTADLHSVLDRLMLGIHSRKRRQQRRMNIENRVREGIQQHGANQSHVTGETDQTNLPCPQFVEDGTIVVGPRGPSPMIDNEGVDP